MPLGDSYIDGLQFTTPQEVEGSPLITTDVITGASIINRSYAVFTASYQPLILAPNQIIKDEQFPNAYLEIETPGSMKGPYTFFSRTFVGLPPIRSEPRLIPFTRPGVSAVQLSGVSALPIGWNQYGYAAPNTRNVTANVDISYAVNALFPIIPDKTQIFLITGANKVPVDYIGQVYTYQGNVIVNIGANQITEPRWQLSGSTFPPALPGIWIQEVQISRWRGVIWQMDVVSVTPP